LAGEDTAAEGVAVQFALAGEYRLADRLSAHELSVEDRDKAPRGFDEHTMAHGRDRVDASLQELARYRGGRVLLGHLTLAGFKEEQRYAVVADYLGQFLGVDGRGAALLQLGPVGGIFEAEGAQAVAAIVDAVAIEVDDVVRRAGLIRPLQLLGEGLERG